MTRFAFKALADSGDVVTGEIEAASPSDARNQIEGRRLLPIEIGVRKEKGTRSGDSPSGRLAGLFVSRPNPAAVTRFLQDLGALIEASIRLDRALELLAAPDMAGPLRPTIRVLATAVLSGEPLSDAFGRFPLLFPDSMRALVAFSELSGSLGETLTAVAAERDRSARLVRKLTDALAYPAFLLAAVAGVLVFFLLAVLPQFRPVIADLGAKADPMLLTLLDVSATLENHRTAAAGIAVFALAGLWLMLSEPTRRARIGTVFLRVPGLSGIDRDYRTARFCRNFGHLTERGVTPAEALTLVGRAVARPGTTVQWRKASDDVRQGRRVFDALADTGALSKTAVQMLRVGEETGRISAIALKAAELYEARVERRLEQLVGIAGPIAILAVSLIVGGLIVSVMSALMSINQLAS